MIKHILQLTDDIDGTVGTDNNPVATSTFTWRGTTYEIDLTDEHEQGLHEALLPFLEHARTSAPDKSKRTTSAPRTGPDPKAVREWAASQGIDVPARGRIPSAVIDAYRAYHAGHTA